VIVVNYGRGGAGALAAATAETLAASDIGACLERGMSVSIKPNLVVPRPAGEGATTHPELVEGIIAFLKDFGIQSISVIENSAVGHSAKLAFKACGYEALRKKYGVPLVDLQGDRAVALSHGGCEIRICETALKADFLINAPVLKAHCQTRMTCCMKNLKGCIPQSEMKRFHSLGLHKPIAALNALLRPGYCVVDGVCGDLTFEEGGTPVEANRVIAGRDPLLVDSYCAALIGYGPDEIEYLSLGREMGLGECYSRETKLVELNPGRKPRRAAKGDPVADRYRGLVDEDAACSVCYAALAFALHRSGGRVPRGGKIKIGQGFRGKSGAGIGIGDCARGFAPCAEGCPPKAADILPLLA